MHSNSHCSIIYQSHDMEAISIQRKCGIHIDNRILLIHKNNEILPFATIWMDLEDNTGEGNGTPLQYSCLENPMDGGAW